MAERAGMGWQEVAADVVLAPGSWHHRLDHRGGPSGAVALAFATLQDLDVAAAIFEDAVVGGRKALWLIDGAPCQRACSSSYNTFRAFSPGRRSWRKAPELAD
jgi:hypothetical protein